MCLLLASWKDAHPLHTHWCNTTNSLCVQQAPSTAVHHLQPDFGLFFDIDGVIVRGGQVLHHAAEAFKLLIDERTGKFWVPTVFVTNAGNCLRQAKAKQLSDWLPVEV